MLSYAHARHHPSWRDPSLDFLRGIAVLLMILAHVIFFVHDGSSSALTLLSRIGNTASFTMFLFISGPSTFMAVVSPNRPKIAQENRHILKHVLILLCGYWTVAAVGSLKDLSSADNLTVFSEIIKVLLFIRVPSFSEFLIPFIAFSFSAIFLRKFYAKVARSLSSVILYSAIFYVLGFILYPLTATPILTVYKSILAGEEGLLRFPLLQYFPVFALGLYWGKLVGEAVTGKLRLAIAIGVVSALTAVTSGLINSALPLALLSPINRWPPSVGFLATGVASVFFFYLIYVSLPKPVWSNWFWRLTDYLGKDAFDLYIIHILILFSWEKFSGASYGLPQSVLSIYAAVLFASVVISSLNYNVSPSLFTIGPVSFGPHARYRVRKRYLGTAILFLGLTLYAANVLPAGSAVGSIIRRSDITGTSPEISVVLPNWAKTEYGFARQLTVKNRSIVSGLSVGETIEVPLDHKALVDSSRADPTGADIMLVYQEEDQVRPVPFALSGPDSETAVLAFELLESVSPASADNRYFLYYGSVFPDKAVSLAARRAPQADYIVNIGYEVSHPLAIKTNRRWFISVKPSSYIVPEDLIISLDNHDAGLISGNVTFEIVGTNVRGSFMKDEDNNLLSRASLANLSPGTYVVRATGQISGQPVTGPSLPLFVSQPVFVVWSLDWEGWDVSDSALSAIEALSVKYNRLPITHFFNPRIYLSSVMLPNRSAELTRWVNRRSVSFGDEIALHLHMHFDLVGEVGLTPKTEPRWGYRSEEGYDVLTTAYSPEELALMFNWSKRMFAENDLPTPLGFRAGGWFADSSVLSALDKSGFLYDSSGRDESLWSGSYKSPWKLTATSLPYYPATGDANVTGVPSLTLLEIPNNGGNTFEHTGEELVARFRANYDGGVAATAKVVTYLMHPQWALRELPRIEPLLSYASRYSFAADAGPVVFTTAASVFEQWKK